MKITKLAILLILISAHIPNAICQPDDNLILLNGDQILEYKNTNITINGIILLRDNSKLILENASLHFAGEGVMNFTLLDNSQLEIINSTITSQGLASIRANDHSSIHAQNANIEGKNKDTGMGIGLSSHSNLEANKLQTDFIRQIDNASSIIRNSKIGDFATISKEYALIQNSTLINTTLLFTNNLIEINQTLHGKRITISSEKISSEENGYPFQINNTYLQNPPDIIVENSILILNKTQITSAYLTGDSVIDVYNSTIDTIYTENYAWITTTSSNIDEILCYNGDFNIEITESNIGSLYTYMSTGMNLKTTETNIQRLKLMYAHTYAPHNIEIVNTTINKMYIKPGGPQTYQFEGSKITEQIILEPDNIGYIPPTLTGGIEFDPNINITSIAGEGTITIKRVYKIKYIENNTPITGIPITILNNQTIIDTKNTDENGEIVFTLNYIKTFEIIEDPTPDGQYLKNNNNLTSIITLKSPYDTHNISLKTTTPLKIETTLSTNINDNTETKNKPIPFTTSGIIISLTLVTYYKRRKNKNTR